VRLRKSTAVPFQEGYAIGADCEIHVFTDYRWNDGSVSRRWHIDPEHFDADLAIVRPVSLKASGAPDQ